MSVQKKMIPVPKIFLLKNINHPSIEVRQTKEKGLGVFALQSFKMEETIEICPCIVFTRRECEFLEKTPLSNYWFAWDSKNPKKHGAIVFGYGSLYNHSSHPNAEAERDYKNNLMHYKCLREIQKGEEITIQYKTVWFEEKE